jgi:hypothetical protein
VRDLGRGNAIEAAGGGFRERAGLIITHHAQLIYRTHEVTKRGERGGGREKEWRGMRIFSQLK